MMGFGCNGMGMGWGGWGGGILGWIVPLLFWGVLLVGLAIGIIWLARRFGRASSTETPLDAARRRLALGEITAAEFDEIAQRLAVKPIAVDR